jgi:predicted DNA binding CopG/RHH family protein
MSKDNYLDTEEKELMESLETGEWISAKNLEEKKKEYQLYAAETFKKDKRVNIRINQHDLEGIKRRALDEGIPYQTLISSIIHKYLNGKLKSY